MPSPAQDIDWPGLRANSVSMGIRPAARAAAVNLPPEEAKRFEERVAKRASREGWEDKRLAAVSTMSTPRTPQGGAVPLPMSTAVLSGADSQMEVNADHSRRGRAALLRYGAEKAEHAANLPDEAGLAVAPLVASLARTLATAGDWSAAVQVGVQINLGRSDVG